MERLGFGKLKMVGKSTVSMSGTRLHWTGVILTQPGHHTRRSSVFKPRSLPCSALPLPLIPSSPSFLAAPVPREQCPAAGLLLHQGQQSCRPHEGGERGVQAGPIDADQVHAGDVRWTAGKEKAGERGHHLRGRGAGEGEGEGGRGREGGWAAHLDMQLISEAGGKGRGRVKVQV